LGSGVWGLGFGVWGSGFGVLGLGFWVWGFGLRVLGLNHNHIALRVAEQRVPVGGGKFTKIKSVN